MLIDKRIAELHVFIQKVNTLIPMDVFNNDLDVDNIAIYYYILIYILLFVLLISTQTIAFKASAIDTTSAHLVDSDREHTVN